MAENKTPSIVIVKREGDEILSEKNLQAYVQESEPKVSGASGMWALVILVGAVAAGAGLVGIILRLFAR